MPRGSTPATHGPHTPARSPWAAWNTSAQTQSPTMVRDVNGPTFTPHDHKKQQALLAVESTNAR